MISTHIVLQDEQAFQYNGEDIATSKLIRSIAPKGDLHVPIEQFNKFLRELVIP